MNTPLRLLLIDDNPDDRSLVIRELRREWPDLQAEQIVGHEQLEAALATGQFDVAITDYQLMWSDGVSVLKMIKQSCTDCPVIMFTGTGSEEIAVEAMKSGLDDYVLKSPKHFARLPAAVRLALQSAAHKRSLREVESKYGILFDAVPIGLYRMAPTGEILDANAAFIEMLGYPDREALLKANVADLHADPGQFRQWREEMERAGAVPYFEARLRRFDRSVCWVENRGKVVRDLKTRLVLYEGSLEDITSRKRAEAERERLIRELQNAFAKVKTLSGLLPICASCKKIRDDKGYWNQIEVYIQSHSEAEFTHSFCPDCMQRLYPEVFVQPGTKFK